MTNEEKINEIISTMKSGSVHKSSRTFNGLKKIKVTMPACGRWKGEGGDE